MANAAERTNKIQPERMTAPVNNGKVPTHSDTVNERTDGRALYVGVGGDVKVTTPAGVDLLFKNMVGGIIHPVEVRRVWSTGTAATDLILLW